MRPARPSSRSTGHRLAIGIAIAAALSAATDVPFSTYFALAAFMAVLPQATACLRRLQRRMHG